MLHKLRRLGITQTVMMTGDSDRTARAIAAQVGVDRCFAEVLPEDKAAFVRDAKAEGHTVVMIGDGINDSPALSAADIGIAIHSGAAIAREIADVTIRADSLEELVTLKAIANALQSGWAAITGSSSASTPRSSFWAHWASCPRLPAQCCITFPPLASACAA